MMKLYYSAGSCSTSCHITLEESGLPYEAVKIDWDNAKDPNIAVVEKLNPLGTLPILITEEGHQLDQNLAIHTYVAEKSSRHLLPVANTIERAQAMNWLSFVASDLHKSIGGLFSLDEMTADSKAKSEVRNFIVQRSNGYIQHMETHLEGREYLMGTDFTPADAYAFVVLGWTKWMDIPLAPYKNVEKYMKRISERPAVAKVLKVEGLA